MFKAVQALVALLKQFSRPLCAVWNALVASKEVREKKRVEVVSDKVDVAIKITHARQKSIEWRIKQLKSMGLTKRQIREEILPEIQNDTDPRGALKLLDVPHVGEPSERPDELTDSRPVN